MNHLIFMLVFSLGVAFDAAPAASDIEEFCSGAIGLSDGQWAGYAVDAAFMRDKQKYRYAIVGTEAGNYWLEYEATLPLGNGAIVMKILIPGWPYAEGAVTRAMMQMPTMEGMDAMPPMEMPPSSIQKDDLADPVRMACAEAQNGVEDTVTVPAGTFNALRIPLKEMGKDIWISSDVPFGIVKLADEDGYGMELTAYGDDAEPAITAAPHMVPGME